ncbi:MAG: hypothetical protein LLG20_02845 [Acidobacteriales bacterium]|nr:hypothetical protein [Terriglobales bacterium]
MKLSTQVRLSTVVVCLAFLALFQATGLSAAQNVPQPSSAQPGDMIFDVRNGDQQGKMMLKQDELVFESLTDARHSMTWKYADIRELSRPKKEIRVKPFKGDRYDFQFKDKKLRDKVYDLITQRILAARHGSK